LRCSSGPGPGFTTVICGISQVVDQFGFQTTIDVVGSTPGDYVVTAFADANILDPNPANNLAGALTTVLGTADLSVSPTAPASVPLGATVRFRAVVTNTGPDLANQILLTLALPDHLAATLVTDVSLNPFSCNLPASSPPVVTCKLNPLVVGSINADI